MKVSDCLFSGSAMLYFLSTSAIFGTSASNIFVDLSSDDENVIEIECREPDHVDFDVYVVNAEDALLSLKGKYPWEVQGAKSIFLRDNQSVEYSVKNVITDEVMIPGCIIFHPLTFDIEESSIGVFVGGGGVTIHGETSQKLKDVEWSFQGLSSKESSFFLDPTQLSPGDYPLTLTSEDYPQVSAQRIVHVIGVDMDQSDEDFFRETTLSLPISITPSSSASLITFSTEGPDDVNWSASYNEPTETITVQNLIERTSPISYLDTTMLRVRAQFEESDNDTWLYKHLNWKKWVPDIYEHGKKSLIRKINRTIDPGEYLADFIRQQLNLLYWEDPDSHMRYYLGATSINTAIEDVRKKAAPETIARLSDMIDNADSKFENRSLVVNESWDFDWKIELTPEFSSGSFSIKLKDSGLSTHAKINRDWLQDVSANGFDDISCDFKDVLFSAMVDSNQQTAFGIIQYQGQVFLQLGKSVDSDHSSIGPFEGIQNFGIIVNFNIRF